MKPFENESIFDGIVECDTPIGYMQFHQGQPHIGIWECYHQLSCGAFKLVGTISIDKFDGKSLYEEFAAGRDVDDLVR